MLAGHLSITATFNYIDGFHSVQLYLLATVLLTNHEVGNGGEDTEGYGPDDQQVSDAFGNEEHRDPVVATGRLVPAHTHTHTQPIPYMRVLV